MRRRWFCGSRRRRWRAATGSDEAGDDAQQGRFAGAVFADDDGAGASFKGRGDVTEGGEGAVDFGDGFKFGGDAGGAMRTVDGLG